EEDHEERGAMGPRERLELVDERWLEDERVMRAAEGLDAGPGSVGGEIEGRCAGEVVFPIAKLSFELSGVQPLALPEGEVCIVEGQRRERIGSIERKSLIERAELPDEDADGPPVGDDVMHREEEDVILGLDAKERRAEERSALQIEGGARVLV